ncbi:hypothetical protein, partial [Actinoplanes cyaneus]|uniref:hypothetical protein n=1 Tax=Actinoplanes cyaneus TaxID=52696 RepID=UPI0031D83F4A
MTDDVRYDAVSGAAAPSVTGADAAGLVAVAATPRLDRADTFAETETEAETEADADGEGDAELAAAASPVVSAA